MSSILDALRSRPVDRTPEGGARRDARAEAVLATLGYPRSSAGARRGLRPLVVYGSAALVTGFSVLSALI